MPELPEVETTRRGIEPHVTGHLITDVVVRDPRLRWPVPADLRKRTRGQRVLGIRRRAKYLLIALERGTIIVHLGMSGSLRLASGNEPARTHDHLDLALDSGRLLRFHDPRRFGCVLFTAQDPLCHPLLARLGVEPLSEAFDGALLEAASRGRRSAVKTLIMDGHVVVGVGNIYASESLFLAGIRPGRRCGSISLARYVSLAQSIRDVLVHAISDGGTTLRDFVNGVGEPGYFAQSLNVYGRAGEPCKRCGDPVRSKVIAQRNTFFCARCQR